MRVRGFSVACIIVLMLLITTECYSDAAYDNATPINELEQNSQLSYEEHDPIVISSDLEFGIQAGNEGWDGNGSETDPYIIEGYNISSSGLCVSINYTAVYFLITDCILLSSTGVIFLDNVQHGKFVDVVFTTESWEGLDISDCQDIQFDSCAINGHLGIGQTDYLKFTSCSIDVTITMTGSDHCVFSKTKITQFLGITSCLNASIEDCLFEGEWGGIRIKGTFSEWDHNFSNNTFNGRPVGFFYNYNNVEIDCSNLGMVLVGYSENITLYNGIFSEGWGPIVMVQGEGNLVTNCTFQDCIYSIYLSDSNSCIISNNTYLNTKYGVGVYSSTNCEITNSTFYGSGTGEGGYALWVQSGSHNLSISNNRISNYAGAIEMFGSDYVTIFDNHFTDNMNALNIRGINVTVYSNHIYHNNNRGIQFYESSGARIWGNYIGWNGNQAIDDDGNHMVWDDDSDLGNYWSDYDGEGEYNIPGTTSSVDRYPRTLIDNDPPTIYVSQNPLIVNSEDSVFINVLIDENYGIDHVSFWYDDSNYTMTKVGLNWTFTISQRSDGTEINYRIYALDWAGNWAVSDTFAYIVGSNISVTNTSTTTSTSDNPFIPGDILDSLPTILLASGILIVVVIVIYSKRRGPS